MFFILFFQFLQHFNGRSFIGFIHLQHFKPSAESLFRLYNFTVLIDGCRADHGNLSSGEFRFQQITYPAANRTFVVQQSMDLINKQHGFIKLFNLFQNVL
ncbi:hypothetical protein D3C86_1516110 [compost metagenome]